MQTSRVQRLAMRASAHARPDAERGEAGKWTADGARTCHGSIYDNPVFATLPDKTPEGTTRPGRGKRSKEILAMTLIA
jgi:hypothetical protein